MIPLRVDIFRSRFAIINALLIIVNALAFLHELTLPPKMGRAFVYTFGLIPAHEQLLFSRHGITLGQAILPMFTSMFLHGGWMHLLFNMWFLWIFGPAMEKRFGSLGFLALYVAGGLTANLVHIATHVDSTEPVIGASGAVAAVIAAYAVTYPWSRVLSFVPLGFIPLIFPLPAFLFAFAWFGMQLLEGSIELTSTTMAASVAWWAHIGGFVFGAAVGLIARRAVPPPVVTQQTSGPWALGPQVPARPLSAPLFAPPPFPPQPRLPARVPADVWRRHGAWRVPDVPQRYPRD
jgi:membrane associated rhomboid family serine protease